MLFPLKRKSFEARNINFIQKRTLPHQATKFAIEGTERPKETLPPATQSTNKLLHILTKRLLNHTYTYQSKQ